MDSTIDTTPLQIKKFHDVFLANLMLILKLNIEHTELDNFRIFINTCNLSENIVVLMNNFTLNNKTPETDEGEYKTYIYDTVQEKVSDNLSKMKSSSESFLQSIIDKKMTMDGISGIIKKIYEVVQPNYELFKSKNPRIFQLKKTKEDTGRQVTMTVIPGIDMIYSWYCLSRANRENLWFYLDNLYISGTRLISLVNNDESIIDRDINYVKLKTAFTEVFGHDSDLLEINNLDVDPFLGIGMNLEDREYGIDDFMNPDKPQVEKPGLSSMAKMLGVDKMLNMDDLKKELKNISKKEIDDAGNNIKSLFGGSGDDGTTNVIGSILSDITDHLKNDELSGEDPLKSIMAIAETVAKKALPRIKKNNVDMTKIMESTKNATSKLIGKEIDNPMNVMNEMIAESEATGKPPSPEDLMKKMMSGLGGGDNMMNPQQMGMLNNMMKGMMSQFMNAKK